MPQKTQALLKKRELMVDTAKTAVILAKDERALADRQHEMAHQMENLGDKLKEEVAAIDGELKAG